MTEATAREMIQAHFDASNVSAAGGAPTDDIARASEIYADDAVVEWPQGGERVRGGGLGEAAAVAGAGRGEGGLVLGPAALDGHLGRRCRQRVAQRRQRTRKWHVLLGDEIASAELGRIHSEIGRKEAANVPVGVPGRGLTLDRLHFQAQLSDRDARHIQQVADERADHTQKA